jgi:hypothetical protein
LPVLEDPYLPIRRLVSRGYAASGLNAFRSSTSVRVERFLRRRNDYVAVHNVAVQRRHPRDECCAGLVNETLTTGLPDYSMSATT